MTLEQELQLSYYKKAGQVNEAHNVWLVQDVRTKEFFIQKTLTVYHPEVYQFLKANPIKNTPQIHELIEDDGVLYVIEEYIPGKTLEEILNQSGPLPEKQVMHLALQLCDILRCFHSLQPPIVNRDLKPSNLKLTSDGVLKLLDLNAARPCRAEAETDTTLLGTRGYAAPEQYGFGASDPRTDIYAAGKLIQTLLTGSVHQKVSSASRFGALIETCTALDPKDRYQSAGELKKALLHQGPGPAADLRMYMKENFLPGFRSPNPLLWLLSAVGYYLLCHAALTIEHPTFQGTRLTLYRILITAAALGIVLLTGNFRGVQLRLLGNCQKLPLRVCKVLAVDGLIFLALVWMVSLL